MTQDTERELGSVVSYLVGRRLRIGELINAMGVSRSGYYLARDTGRLITADNLMNIAKSFDLNPIDLMVRFGLINNDTAIEYVENLWGTKSPRAKSSRAKTGRTAVLRRQPDSPPL